MQGEQILWSDKWIVYRCTKRFSFQFFRFWDFESNLDRVIVTLIFKFKYKTKTHDLFFHEFTVNCQVIQTYFYWKCYFILGACALTRYQTCNNDTCHHVVSNKWIKTKDYSPTFLVSKRLRLCLFVSLTELVVKMSCIFVL